MIPSAVADIHSMPDCAMLGPFYIRLMQALMSPSPVRSRLERLLAFHESDPANVGLLREAIEAAYDAHDHVMCDALLGRLAALQPLTDEQCNVRGLNAMAQGHFAEAEAIFAPLSASTGNAGAVFNLAYAKAMQGNYAGALTLLNDDVLASQPLAVPLKMQVLHHLSQLDDMIELGKQHTDHPQMGEEVCGLLATALLDQGDMEASRRYAARSPETASGHTVTGLLALDDAQDDAALQHFESALALQPQSGRARLGEGLAWLAKQQYDRAAQSLQQAAELLATHAGTWVAAGWAHLLNEDIGRARACFEQAITLEPGFSEAVGGLAMVSIHEGDMAQAKHWTEAALRLDRESLTGGAAQSLLLVRAGNAQAAQAAWQSVIHQPLGPDGKTVAAALARRSLQKR